MATLAVCNSKGGSGKTTSAVCISEVLARVGARVLFVDLDPGASASAWIGSRSPAARHLLTGGFDVETHVRRVFHTTTQPARTDDAPTETEGVIDLVGADASLSDATGNGSEAPLRRLRRFFDAARKVYDVVVLDTPPQTGLLVSVALIATDTAVVPVAAGRGNTDGLNHVLDVADDVGADVQAAFTCNVDPQESVDVGFARHLVEAYGVLGLGSSTGRACRHYVRTSADVREAEANRLFLGRHAPTTAPWADYRGVTYELTQAGALDLPHLARSLSPPDDVARLDLSAEF